MRLWPCLVLATACSGLSRPPDGGRTGGKKGPASVTVAIEPGIGEEPWLAFRDGDVGWEHLDAGATRPVTAPVFEVAAYCPALPHRAIAQAYLYRVRRGDAARIEIERCLEDTPRAPMQIVKLAILNVTPSRTLLIHTYGKPEPHRIETDPFTTDTSADATSPRGLRDTVFVEGVSESATDFAADRLLIRRDIFYSTGSRKRVDLAGAGKLERVPLSVEGALPDEQVAVATHLTTARGTVATLANKSQAPLEVRRAPAHLLSASDRQIFQASASSGEPGMNLATARHIRGSTSGLRLPPPVPAPTVRGEAAQASVSWAPSTHFDWYELKSQSGSGVFVFRSPTKSLGARVEFTLPPPVPWFEATWHSEDRESWQLSGWRGPENSPWSAWTELSQRTVPGVPVTPE